MASIVPFLLLGLLEMLPSRMLGALAYFVAAGIWALYAAPRLLGVPYGRKPVRDYLRDIRLSPAAPVARNVALGLCLAALTLGAILAATLLTGQFALDWSMAPGLRWVKGLTRGVWEEVFFRGILLALLVRVYPVRAAVLWSSAVFAVVHLNTGDLSPAALVDILSIFFMALLFTFVVLRTGSLLAAIVFHYVHDVFVDLVQNAPGANEALAATLLYAFLWAALAAGAWVTATVVKRWPTPRRAEQGA
jgi:membrane protease YdiL (CAAX protease family)